MPENFLVIQEFVKLSLSEYNNAIESEGFCFSDKDIFDFVWGTVNFNSSRFSHTIGVTEAANRMARVIKSHLNMTTGENQERIYDIKEFDVLF